MIKLHRIDGSEFVLNAEQIETIEATPETVIRLLNGKVYVVSDSIDQVLTRTMAFKRSVFEGVWGQALGMLPSRWGSRSEEPS